MRTVTGETVVAVGRPRYPISACSPTS